MSVKTARYRCLGCQHEFDRPPKPCHDFRGTYMGFTYATECPMCGHLYLKWLNFEEFAR